MGQKTPNASYARQARTSGSPLPIMPFSLARLACLALAYAWWDSLARGPSVLWTSGQGPLFLIPPAGPSLTSSGTFSLAPGEYVIKC